MISYEVQQLLPQVEHKVVEKLKKQLAILHIKEKWKNIFFSPSPTKTIKASGYVLKYLSRMPVLRNGVNKCFDVTFMLQTTL